MGKREQRGTLFGNRVGPMQSLSYRLKALGLWAMSLAPGVGSSNLLTCQSGLMSVLVISLPSSRSGQTSMLPQSLASASLLRSKQSTEPALPSGSIQLI